MDARLESGAAAGGEAFAQRVLAATAAALPLALRAPPLRLAEPVAEPEPAADSSEAQTSQTSHSSHSSQHDEPRHNQPLAHTLYNVFRHLALEFEDQVWISI